MKDTELKNQNNSTQNNTPTFSLVKVISIVNAASALINSTKNVTSVGGDLIHHVVKNKETIQEIIHTIANLFTGL